MIFFSSDADDGKWSEPTRRRTNAMTLRAADAPGYLADLIREAEFHLERAHGLLDAAEQIMQKMADGEKISL